MKKTLIGLLLLTVLVGSAFGVSLRMDTMGRTNIALADFETDVERNPASILQLESNYARFTFGMYSANTEISTKETRFDVLDWNNEWDAAYSFSSMPMGINAYYKMGMLAFGLQFDMPKGTYTFENTNYNYQVGTTEFDKNMQNDEFIDTQQNFALTIGSKVANFDIGLIFGQYSNTLDWTSERSEDGDDAWEHDRWNDEFEASADNTFYGFGVVYPTGKMQVEFAYKMASVAGEQTTTRDDFFNGATNITTIGDVADHDIYPIIEFTMDSSMIHLLWQI